MPGAIVMTRIIIAAALALAVCACVSAPPRYDYAIIFAVPADNQERRQ